MNPRQQELLFDLESDIEEVRKSALIWLAQIGDHGAIPALRKVIGGEDVALRHFAKRALDETETRHAAATGEQVDLAPEDLERYLEGRPVNAREGALLYRARKFARRNLLPVLVASAVLLLVTGSAVGLALQRSAVLAERNRAEQAAASKTA